VIANGGTDPQDRKRRMALAVELRTGEMRWAVPANENSSPAVHGDLMAMHGTTNVCLYRLSATKAELLGSWPCAVGGSSPVLNDAWLFAGEKSEKLAVGIADLRERWRSRGGGNFSSDVLTADGLLIGAAGFYAADSGKVLTKAPPMLECTSPAVSGDRLVVRAADGVTCYRMEALK